MTEHYFSEKPLSEVKIFTIKPFIRNRQYQLKTCSGVFSYKKIDNGTQLLLKYMQIPLDASYVLDMGTGYGVIGLVVASENPQIKVSMIDVNQRAVWISRENLKLNNITNAKVYYGDFYEPIKFQKEKYDIILTNPPLSLGHKPIIQFISETPNYLKLNGLFYFVIKTKHGAKKFSEIIKRTFDNLELLAIQGGYRLYRSQKISKEK